MSGAITEIDSTRFEADVLGSDEPIVLDFYSTECPPCDALAPKYQALAELYGQDVRFFKIYRQGNRELAERLGVRGSPTLVFFERGREVGARLSGAIKRSELQRELDGRLPIARVREIHRARRRVETRCDVLILGAGPAGVTAGIYAAQAKLDTLMVDVGLGGGNLSITHQVSNFPGFPTPQPGYQLAHSLLEHAKAAGVKTRFAAELSAVDLHGRWVLLDGVESIEARKLVVATGSSPRPLGVPGEQAYKGKGISYCATCDAKYYEGKHVVVIGGGNSAVEEASFIAKFAAKISLVHQRPALSANQQALERILSHDKFEFHFEHEPREFVASNGKTLDAVVVEDLKTGTRRAIGCDGAFVFAGMRPNLEPFGADLLVDPLGYVRVDERMRTNIPGVFAAGDVVSKRFRQMTTAVSDGTVAAMALVEELGS